MNFQRVNYPLNKTTEMWGARRGFWSFLIAHDPGEKFITSYRDARKPKNFTMGQIPTVMFYEDKEVTNVRKVDFGYDTFTEAVKACEAKYRELLLR